MSRSTGLMDLETTVRRFLFETPAGEQFLSQVERQLSLEIHGVQATTAMTDQGEVVVLSLHSGPVSAWAPSPLCGVNRVNLETVNA